MIKQSIFIYLPLEVSNSVKFRYTVSISGFDGGLTILRMSNPQQGGGGGGALSTGTKNRNIPILLALRRTFRAFFFAFHPGV